MITVRHAIICIIWDLLLETTHGVDATINQNLNRYVHLVSHNNFWYIGNYRSCIH